ncbi:MAG: class I SAM-dependent methyltransferase [Planctomycetota bacterium]
MEIDESTEALHYEAQGRLQAMGNYHRWILRNLERGLGRRVWDAGAGIGLVSSQVAERVEYLLATEYTEANIETLRGTFRGADHVEVAHCDLTAPDEPFLLERRLDTVIHLDVLEHLEDDAGILALFHRVLVPGGRLLLKVPAHRFLFGTLDEASLHYRRYGKRDLRAKLEAAGFEVERLRAMNLAAVGPYLLKGRVLKKRTNFSNSLSGSRLGFYDGIIPWLERVERVVPPPVGLSLVAIARKPGAGSNE